ncbi:hypothetical protein [Streptomyces sp. NPDC056061]|uniref:hypothetical protein n=1 Tax=Streptomyces sp. NPDC056061 TaxID=3345700 RepID=UPI0035D8C8F4
MSHTPYPSAEPSATPFAYGFLVGSGRGRAAGASARPSSPPPLPEPAHAALHAAPHAGRKRHGLALGLVAASVVPAVLGGASAARAVDASSAAAAAEPGIPSTGRQADCGDAKANEFPIRTRIHGGPDTYASGGGYGTWFLDLTNTTDETCRAIHPVLVLVDEARKLTDEQIQLVFSEDSRPDMEHRVAWETTDQDEHIGVFDGDADSFDGFTVPAGRTVTVRIRMAFTSDTGPGRVTAGAAIVQRLSTSDGGKGADDGAWVGDSDDYVFAIVGDGESDGGETGTGGTGTGGTGAGEADAADAVGRADAAEGGGTGDTGGTGDSGDAGGADRAARPLPSPDRSSSDRSPSDYPSPGRPSQDRPSPDRPRTDSVRPSAPAVTGDTVRPVVPGRTAAPKKEMAPETKAAPERVPEPESAPESGHAVPELATTGPAGLPYPGVTVAGFLLGGGAAVVWSRRARRPRS